MDRIRTFKSGKLDTVTPAASCMSGNAVHSNAENRAVLLVGK